MKVSSDITSYVIHHRFYDEIIDPGEPLLGVRKKDIYLMEFSIEKVWKVKVLKADNKKHDHVIHYVNNQDIKCNSLLRDTLYRLIMRKIT